MVKARNTFSPKEIARAIGVSESSLKRWADDGQIQFTRTVGGHRRIALTEAIRFARESNLPIIRPDILGLPDLSLAQNRLNETGDFTDTLFECLRQGQADDTRSLIVDRYLAGESLAELCDHPLRESLSRIGELWKHERRGIAIEHRAIDICVQSLSLMRSLIEPTKDDAPVALGGAPEGDPYLLPSIMASAVLAEVGFDDHNLGPNTPFDTLHSEVEHLKPKLVWLSFSVSGMLEKHVAKIEEIHETLLPWQGRMVVGGRVLERSLPRALIGKVQLVHSMVELGAFASGLISVESTPAADKAAGNDDASDSDQLKLA